MSRASRRPRDPARFDLWLDKRIPECDPRFNGEDPFADESRYPGVRAAHRGEKLPDGTTLSVGSFLWLSNRHCGFTAFSQPRLWAEDKARWDAKRYYENDPTYMTKDLVQPYRVTSCSFCYVGPNPLKPPSDPNNPKWENLSSNVGAQYFCFNRIFAWEADKESFLFQALSTYRQGAGHLAGFHRLHRQPENHKRGLLSDVAVAALEARTSRRRRH